MQRLRHIDGIRGIAASIVVLAHFLQFFLPSVFSLKVPDHFGERSLAFTPVNIIFNGGFAVNMFFVLSGIVLAVPFFAGKGRVWYVSAALKRYPRLAIPAVASTVFAWAVSRTVGFHYAQAVPLTGANMPDFFSTITSLPIAIWQGLIGAFFTGDDSYNKVLWTIRIELLGSAMIFLAIPIIGASRWRYPVYAVGLAALANSHLLGFVAGALIADVISNVKPHKSPTLSLILLTVGIYLGSFPYFPFSHTIWAPLGVIPWIDPYSVMPVVGASLCVLAANHSPLITGLLCSRPIQFLGRISYSMYLVHFTFFASIGCLLVLRLTHAVGYSWAITVASLVSAVAIPIISHVFCRLADDPAIRFSGRFATAISRIIPRSANRVPPSSQ